MHGYLESLLRPVCLDHPPKVETAAQRRVVFASVSLNGRDDLALCLLRFFPPIWSFF